jgi:C-terminal processing protease CtpA/Prc
MKARLAGSDWSGLEAELKEVARLVPRDQFAQRLTQLKDDAAQRQSLDKTAILTKTAQAQISDLQAMIDRYLDDEAFAAYAEALKEGTADVAKAKAKKEAKKAVTTRAPVPPSVTKGDAPAPARPSGAPAPGQPKRQAPPQPATPSVVPF